MKVIYYTKDFLADCDFPLIKELQDKGVDIRAYMPLANKFKNSSILELEKPIKRYGLYKASNLPEMLPYKDCIDLERLYIISGFRPIIYWPFSWLLFIWTIMHMLFQKADVFHFTWQFSSFDKLFLWFKIAPKRVMTVHDPFSHSSNDNPREERDRIRSFKWSNRFVLLSSNQVNSFSAHYNISKDVIFVSKLGSYDSYAQLAKNINEPLSPQPYILFFGMIKEYKGLKFLLDAMKQVHSDCPNLRLVVAGGGPYYYDNSEYEKLDYIEFRHRYIGMNEMIGLISHARFAVCPYIDATQSGVVQTAFSLECPMIVTNVGSLSNCVKNEVTGLVVEPKDITGLAEAIIRLHKSSDMLQQMRENIIKTWKPLMSWNLISQDYLKCYQYEYIK